MKFPILLIYRPKQPSLTLLIFKCFRLIYESAILHVIEPAAAISGA